MRPFPILPEDNDRDEFNHRNHDHQHGRPGSWHNPGYHNTDGSDEGMSQVPSIPDYNIYPNSHTSNHRPGAWNPEEGVQRTESPLVSDNPDIDVRTGSGRRGYGRTNTDFPHPGPYGSTAGSGKGQSDWPPPIGSTNVGRFEPSQPEPAGRQPGVFIPSSWRGQTWSESGNRGPTETPTPAQKNEWNQGTSIRNNTNTGMMLWDYIGSDRLTAMCRA